MKKKAVIISIKSYNLSNKEIRLFSAEKPWGLILFKRNIKSLKQVKKLTRKIKKITNDPKFPIMIDEEGKILEIYISFTPKQAKLCIKFI